MNFLRLKNRWRKPALQAQVDIFRDGASRQTPVAGFDLLSLAVRSMR